MAYLAMEMLRTEKTGARPWKDNLNLPVCMNIDEKIRGQAKDGLHEPDDIADRTGEYNLKIQASEDLYVTFTMKRDYMDSIAIVDFGVE